MRKSRLAFLDYHAVQKLCGSALRQQLMELVQCHLHQILPGPIYVISRRADYHRNLVRMFCRHQYQIFVKDPLAARTKQPDELAIDDRAVEPKIDRDNW